MQRRDWKHLEDAVQNLRQKGVISQMWVAAGAEHLMAMSSDPLQYRRRLEDFLVEALSSQVPQTNPQSFRYDEQRSI
jgi:hypothetical protein